MEYEEIEEIFGQEQEFDVGDCVHTSTGESFVGLVIECWHDRDLECWQYKVLWNDGDKTDEDYESELILAKDWTEER